ncbi:hypothetical protein CTAYLR_003208 [Chrysophaeum taylorii]|uniref:Mitochondrial import inner membrane translocase subunit TIM23 n=1 Tax=Chrysophaeum taylorii TaxID=2483200 RepID=A0AAD7UB66_9STRA|nr:hypothetical protein CTAYLR_003208 [Chrysophaeum taylorii]
MSDEIDVGALAPMFGVRGSEPEYLEYDIRGRGLFERMFFNCGASFLVGMTIGGAVGVWEGSRPGTFRVKTNAMMNGFGKRGSAVGNGFGAVAMLYTLSENLLENFKLDQWTPVAAGVTTGVLYKSMAGPRAIALAGLIGGVLSGALHLSPISPR